MTPLLILAALAIKLRTAELPEPPIGIPPIPVATMNARHRRSFRPKFNLYR